MPPGVDNLEALQKEWKEMFQKTLPSAATSKSPAQSKWPVHVDHCFARIILDSTVGIDKPWMDKIKSPAYKNMSREQLEASIQLGRQILDGNQSLVDLDSKSLQLRGKGKNASGKASGKMPRTSALKRKRESDDEREDSGPSPPKTVSDPTAVSKSKEISDDLKPFLKKIASSSKTPYQKRVLTALCQVPRGHFTTYAAISNHLSSSPRAVGNALRNNPFAPQVPCHRVLASSGGIGGFEGSWGRNGKEGLNDNKKRGLLRDEGVKFDGRGRVVGSPWSAFK